MLRPPSRSNSSLAVALAACALLSACQRAEEVAAEPEARPVRSITIEKADAGDVVVLSGRVAAEDEIAVAFRIPGRMIERPVNVGDRVRQGQVMARLEQMNERNQLLSAQAALNAANADRVRARDELQRQESLIDEGFTTRAKLDKALAAFRAAEAQVKSAAAQVQMAEDLVGFTVLTAEFDGSVIARGAEPGEVVQGGQMVVRIARAGGVDAVFEVPPQVLVRRPARGCGRGGADRRPARDGDRSRPRGLAAGRPDHRHVHGARRAAEPAARHAARLGRVRPRHSSRASS